MEHQAPWILSLLDHEEWQRTTASHDSYSSDPYIIWRGQLAFHAASIFQTKRFKKKNMTFLCCNRFVFRAFWDYEHFTFLQNGFSIMKMNFQPTLQNQKNLIRFRMMMP